MILGAHCSMCAPNYLLGSVQEALSYKANALMVYTGPPQNTLRKPIELLKVDEAKNLLKENHIPIENMVVHAPYIINLANCVNEKTFELAKDFLRKEIDRVQQIGAQYLVLHPGSYTTATLQEGIAQIIAGLNEVLKEDDSITICLETMAGKGSEIGTSFEELKEIMDGVKYNDKLAVCLDTCHIHDAGYDLTQFDDILNRFDEVIGLERLKVIHVNDSKNACQSHKDRHANIGEGMIGFDALNTVVHHPKCKDIIKILETPWINKKAPYRYEIEMLKNQSYDPEKLNVLKEI